jgi:hypothetical protein
LCPSILPFSHDFKIIVTYCSEHAPFKSGDARYNFLINNSLDGSRLHTKSTADAEVASSIDWDVSGKSSWQERSGGKTFAR